MAELIGTGRCPVCGSAKARYSVSAKSLAVVTCNACNFQGFARSDRSDELLRANINAGAIAASGDGPPLPPPTSTAPPPPPAAPAPVAESATAPPPPPRQREKFGWGIFAGMEK